MFLAQIGFYILNLTVAEVSILFKEQAVYRTVLDFALVFIVDDYIIIHNYSNKLEKILVAHKWRIAFFNLVLTVGAVATLVSLNLYGYLIVYLTIALLLLFVTETNISRVATA